MELLVALLKTKVDFAILLDEGWYRIPAANAPKRWPPQWLAFYQPKAFGDDAYRIRYFGRVSDIQIVKRRDLFPNELTNAKSETSYYRLHLKSLEELELPIPSLRPRRLVFVPTTWQKFNQATQINDLFDDSPLENRLWDDLKHIKVNAERQWLIKVGQQYYHLDFAVFCNQGQIDIETDGDFWHAQPKRIRNDNQRNNDLASIGWRVLRFNTKEIQESSDSYCLGKIEKTITTLGGLSDEGIVPRVFYPFDPGAPQQLSLFEQSGAYRTIEAEPFDQGE
jgi:very-short-patch-repair endonuclease